MEEAKRQYKAREALTVVLPTLAVVATALLLVKILDATGLLPLPAVSTDPDSTVLVHQARASLERDPAEIILLGDSTCLIGVDPVQLAQGLCPRNRVLNLSLLIWLDLGVYGNVLSDFARANPGQVRAVVLLVSPGKLGGAGRDALTPGSDFWRGIEAAAGGYKFKGSQSLGDWCGVTVLRDKLINHFWNVSIHARGEALFGFSSQVDDYMREHRGGMIEPGTFLTVRNTTRTDWKLSPGFEAQTRLFRSRVPPGAKLIIGVTPVPKSMSSPDARVRRDQLLHDWNRTILADGLLTNLPPVLADVYFSSSGHLNQFGLKKFTASLRESLSQILPLNYNSSAGDNSDSGSRTTVK